MLNFCCRFVPDLDGVAETTLQSFDQGFAEQIATILYKQVQLRADVCKALQNLVDSNKAIVGLEDNGEQVAMRTGISTAEAQQNLEYLATFAGNVLAVLFNVYSETLPQYRGYILTCINAYLSITPQEVRHSQSFQPVDCAGADLGCRS